MNLQCGTTEMKGKDMYKCFWLPVEGNEIMHKCKLCESFEGRQNLQFGYANLTSHIKKQHPNDWEPTFKTFLNNGKLYGPMDKMLHLPTPKAHCIHRWISWIIDDNLPFTFCEKKSTRNNTNLDKMCVPTLKKYMKLLQKQVSKKIRKMLPPTFGLIIDGWM